MDILNFILLAKEHVPEPPINSIDWWRKNLVPAISALVTFVALLVTMCTAFLKPLSDSKKLNDKTLLMIHLSSNKELEILRYFYNVLENANTTNVNLSLPTQYLNQLRHLYPYISDYQIANTEDAGLSYKKIGQKIKKIYIVGYMIHRGFEIKKSQNSSLSLNLNWFSDCLELYERKLTNLLENHYNSLNNDGIELITDRILQTTKMIEYVNELPSNFYNYLDDMCDEYNPKPAENKIDEFDKKIDEIKDYIDKINTF
ncbi:hypothetical protein D0402_12185 [Staphylococcus epidermidis]|uniref:hypothetical protein n=1 Tax=Staphylococcus epidermidis TaxID=1282 RepID=UPI001932EF39|nr:hypothetical protein [Staphylococcus epidermidis]MBM0751711.1 hypothetical protein [Staphylococcus epidermidis]MBM0774768.1 hypothetical protein [Staphylococcus epidermidis]MBM0782583.1 hypothetical protein [Staphylococcus epidermidis]